MLGMRWWVLVSVGVFVVVWRPGPCHAEESKGLFGSIIDHFSNFWKNGEMEFMGQICRYSYSPKFQNWGLTYSGKMWCPGWAPFAGNSRTLSRAGAIENATKDFVRKAVDHGLITAEEASVWLQ
ncbi:anti-lipopolysaccharide factor [Procambarus clarkii]|uniref:ALF2 n=1 Tax=Procambarus clarkii TaxID=6728 RepID=A0A1S5RQT1_PROCL|nr:anti-lipopolysaccharide factor-like [Procambarus clarkii]AOG75595.1 ALF2 [Procambarus clarkii]